MKTRLRKGAHRPVVESRPSLLFLLGAVAAVALAGGVWFKFRSQGMLNADAHYQLGVIAMQSNDTTTALAEFLETIHYNPGNFKAHNNAGLIYLNDHRLDDAEFHFKETLRLNPGDAIAAGNLRLVAQERAHVPR